MRDDRFLLIHLIQTPDDTERANTNFLADGVTGGEPLEELFQLEFLDLSSAPSIGRKRNLLAVPA